MNYYTRISNAVLQDKRLSLAAKGLFGLMLSYGSGWKYHPKELATRSKSGRDATYNALNELIEFGYIIRTRINSKDGVKYEYFPNPDFQVKGMDPNTGNQDWGRDPSPEAPVLEAQSGYPNPESPILETRTLIKIKGNKDQFKKKEKEINKEDTKEEIKEVKEINCPVSVPSVDPVVEWGEKKRKEKEERELNQKLLEEKRIGDEEERKRKDEEAIKRLKASMPLLLSLLPYSEVEIISFIQRGYSLSIPRGSAIYSFSKPGFPSFTGPIKSLKQGKDVLVKESLEAISKITV